MGSVVRWRSELAAGRLDTSGTGWTPRKREIGEGEGCTGVGRISVARGIRRQGNEHNYAPLQHSRRVGNQRTR